MMSQILESEVVWRLGWGLLHSLWQIALLGVLAAVLLRSLKRQSPQLRYAIACGAMAAMLLPLIGTIFLLDIDANGQIVSRNQDTSYSQASVRGSPGVAEPAAPNPALGTDLAARMDEVEPTLAGRHVPWLAACLPWIVATWLLGCAVLSVWNLGAWIAAQRLRRLTTAPATEHLRQRLLEIAGRMHNARPVELLESMLVKTPMVIGYFRPVILLPAALHSTLTVAELDALLAHELAHIRRHDYLVNLLQTLTETLLFFHPAVWWLSARIRIEREYCCDDIAASYSGRIEYARALASVAQGCAAPHLVMAARGQRTSPIVNRVRRVLGAPATDGSTWLGAVLFALIMIVPLIVGLSFATADDGPDTADPPSPERRQLSGPIGFSDDQDITLSQGRQKTFAGIEVELVRRRGTPALRFFDLYALRVDAKMWTDKTAQAIWKEYQEGAFAVLPGERGAWIPLGGKLPIVIYLGGVGLVEVREYSEGDPLTVNLRYKLLKFPPGHLGYALRSDGDKPQVAHDDAPRAKGQPPLHHLPDDYGVIHEVRLSETDKGEPSYFDLDRGRSVTLRPDEVGAARYDGADLATSPFLSDSRTLVTVEMAAIVVDDDVFDSPRPDTAAIRDVLKRPLKSAIVGGSRRTWYFRTAEQNVGVMQILPLREDPRRVLVRWRLAPRTIESDEDRERAARLAAEDRARAARLAAEDRKAAGSREIFRPTSRGSGKTSWSKAFPARLVGGAQGHMMLVHAHRGDRWPVTLRGETEPLFHAELLDGDDEAVKVRITRAGEAIERTLKRDKSQELEIGDKKYRIAYVSTTTAKTQEPLLVEHATIMVEILGAASSDDTPGVDENFLKSQ